MSSLPIGIASFSILLIAMLLGVDARIFLNWHSILLVLGGTLAILFSSAPWAQIASLWKSILDLFSVEVPKETINQTLITLAKGARSVPAGQHPLLSRASGLWEQGIEPELFEILLHQSLDEMNQSLDQAVTTLKNLSKYPPALGMTGTVMGLVALFSKLGPDQTGNMGQSLALAMTATFYGLLLANALILPLSDRLSIQQVARSQFNDYLFRSLILIHRGETASVIEDKVNDYAA